MPATGFHALQKFRDENRTLSISIRWSAWIPVRRPGRLLTLLLPFRHHGRGTRQCRVCHRQRQSLTDGGRSGEAQRNTEVARLSTLTSVPRVGPILWVDSAELRWTHDKIQRLFTCEHRMKDVVTDLHRGRLLPSDLRMIKIVHWESKWYSHNNRLVQVLWPPESTLLVEGTILLKRMLHWYVGTLKNSTFVPVFLTSCRKTDRL